MLPSMKTVRPSRLLAAALLLPILASAQVPQEFWGRGRGWRREPLRVGLPERGGVVDRGFTFCHLLYTSVRRESGGYGWSTDYPEADRNFVIRLSQLTTAAVSRWDDGEPGFTVVRATDDELYQCPFLFTSDVGTMGLSELEALRLRDYLLKGGFLWVDDFWGTAAWEAWASQLARVLPPREYPIHDLPLDHPVFRTLFDVQEVPQIPSIQFWRGSGSGTSERGRDSATPHLRGVSDHLGNLMVLMTHNTDIADAWEREGEDQHYFYSFSPAGYALGINVLLYAMTH